ncbi:uncharacterized protein LOC62_06G007920 [Vanrija pseudolonga]|uniref:Uncharacterized protein n=1 Tax=Vanrija pseudolonga TaxID=143232 RepID=A0AAF0YI60_9TREE|nr:hypothetical protein LOC62_06G007920 [Vanrija pseudolonga]
MLATLPPPSPPPPHAYSPLSTTHMFDLPLLDADEAPAPCQTPPLSPPCQRILLEQLRAAAAAQPASEFDPEALLTAALGAVGHEQQRKLPATTATVALRTCPPLTPLASRRRVSALVITTPAPLSASYGTMTDDTSLSPAHAPPSPSDSGASASPQSEYSAMFRSASPESDSSPSSAGHGFKRVSGSRAARRSDEAPRAEQQPAAPLDTTAAAAAAAPSPSTTPKPTPRHQPRSTGSISRPPGGNFVLGAKAALGLLRKRGSQRSTTL